MLEYTNLDAPIAIHKGVGLVPNTRYLILCPTYKVYISKISFVSPPNYVQDAFTNLKWKSSIIDEMKALHKNHIWELITLPIGKKIVGCR